MNTEYASQSQAAQPDSETSAFPSLACSNSSALPSYTHQNKVWQGVGTVIIHVIETKFNSYDPI